MNELCRKIKFGKSYQVDWGCFLGDYMLVHPKHDLKLYLGFRPVPFLKKRFVWKVNFVKVGPL